MRKFMSSLFLFLQIGLVLMIVYQFTGVSDQNQATQFAQIVEAPAPTSTPTPISTPAPTKPRPTEPHYKYIINKYSMKFHLPDCSYAQKMNPDNKQYSNSSRAILVSLGYDPCNWCNP